jgi:hypothetical protein
MTDNLFENIGATVQTNVDLNSSTWDVIEISRCYFSLDTNDVAIAGETNSLNIATGGAGLISANLFSTGTNDVDHNFYTIGIDHSDLKWDWSGNVGADNSAVVGGIRLTNSPLAVAIASTGVAVPLDGLDWVGVEVAERFNVTSNRLFYTGRRTAKISVSTVVALDGDANNKDFFSVIMKNGTTVENSKMSQGVIPSGDRHVYSVHWVVTMAQGDYLEMGIGNDTDATDLDVWAATMVVSGD